MKIQTLVGLGILLLAAGLLNGCSTPQVNKPADLLFKEGQEAYQNGNYEDAIAQWKKVKESYQLADLITQAELNIADAYFLNQDFIEAAAAYEDFRKLHPAHPRAAYALYRQGMSYFSQVNRIDTDQTPLKNALSIFESYLKLYPAGEQRAEMQEKIAECKDRQLQYEIYVGVFYLKTEAYKSAIGRFEEALRTFPDQPRRDELLFYLGRAYLEDGQRTKGREMFARLSREFPSSRYIADANKVMDKFF